MTPDELRALNPTKITDPWFWRIFGPELGRLCAELVDLLLEIIEDEWGAEPPFDENGGFGSVQVALDKLAQLKTP